MRVAGFLLAVAALSLPLARASAADQIPVRTTPLREMRPVAGGPYLAWSQDRRRQPQVYAVYARTGNGRPFRVTEAGTRGVAGGISGSTLVYQAILNTQRDVRGFEQSNIRAFDLRSRRPLPPPRGVNTKGWEWRPTLSGDWLLFSRHRLDLERVILRNLRTGEQRVLDGGRMPEGRNVAIAGQVNGSFAVWERCPSPDTCTAFRYDIRTRTRTPLPPPPGRIHYGAAVAPDGTAYVGRSTPGCGKFVEIWRYPVVGLPTLLVRLPAGSDFQHAYAVRRARSVEVFLDRGACRGRQFDIYKVVDRG